MLLSMKRVMKSLTWIMSSKKRFESTLLHLCMFKLCIQLTSVMTMIHISYRTNRVCSETTTIGGVTFPKGAQVVFPIKELHQDSKYWEEPEKFNPDRYNNIMLPVCN